MKNEKNENRKKNRHVLNIMYEQQFAIFERNVAFSCLVGCVACSNCNKRSGQNFSADENMP